MARPREGDRDVVRTVVVKVRVRPLQHKRWVERANREGVPLSTWIRMVVDRAARTG